MLKERERDCQCCKEQGKVFFKCVGKVTERERERVEGTVVRYVK